MSQNLKRQSSSQRSLNQYQLEPVQSCSSYLSKMKSQFSTLYSQTDFNLPKSCVDSLKLSGILYLPGTMITRFSSQCTKTDWESSTYTTKYGSFQMSLTIIETLMDFSIIACQQFGRGAYSQVFLFSHQQKTYVLKCIKIGKKKEESVELALRQIFMAKIFSVLKIGPKLCPIFSYDAIILKNKIIFIMQKCETKYTKAQIEEEKVNKNLYESLNLMHSLHICHIDIKLQNIGWSPSLHKFVFLDFNLSQVVPENIGYKSQVSFAGSYHYCSTEMKRLYTLKKRGYVDLYYNDLVGLQITMSEINAKLVKQGQSQHRMLQQQGNKINEQLRRHAIVSYFKMKRNIFELDLHAIKSAIETENRIHMTMLQLLQNMQQKSKKNKEKTQQIQKLHQHLTQRIRTHQIKPHQIDYLLSSYQQQHKSTILTNLNFHKINEIANSIFLLKQVWNDVKWKQHIFDFIDIYQNQNICYKPTRQLLINNLCHIIGVTGRCHVSCFRKLLLMFFQDFFCGNNLGKMERIMGYFVLMRDHVNLAAMEDKLLMLLLNQGQYQMYINMNLKLFIAKSISMMKIPYSLNNRFIKNLQQLQTNLLNSVSTLISPDFLSFTRQSIIQIKQLTQYFNRNIDTANYSQINQNSKRFIQNMKHLLDQDNIKIHQQFLIDKILIGQFHKLNISQECRQDEYESFWVHKWIFYVKFFCMQQFNKRHQFLEAMRKQKFNWFYIYETAVQIFQREQCKQIYQSLLDSNVISQRKFPIHAQYFEILIKQMPKPQFFKYFVYSLHHMPLSNVQDFTHVFQILNVLLKIFVDVAANKGQFLKLFEEGDMDTLSQDVEFLLYLVVLTQSAQYTGLVGHQMSSGQIDTNFKIIHLNLLVRLLICELNEDITGANDTVLRLLKLCKNRKYPKWYQVFCIILKSIDFKFPRTTQIEISHLLISKAELQFEQLGKQGYVMAVAPDFLINILNSYAELNKFQQCFIYLKQLCKTIVKNESKKKTQIYFYSILDFITHKCSDLILRQFVIDNLQQKLQQFSKYPMLCCFIGFAMLKTMEENYQYDQNTIRRVKLVVYYFDVGESYLAVRVMRMKLAWLIQCRSGNKFRTKLYRKMGYTRKLVDVIENEMKSIAGKRKNYLLCLENIKQKLLSQIQLLKLPIDAV